eukprot:gene39220-biopygen20613
MGGRGFRIIGASDNDQLGFSVSRAGDVNNDGIDDIVLGAPSAHGSGLHVGLAYVLFGHNDSRPFLDMDLLQPYDGFLILGAHNSDRIGTGVSAAGDFNGDGCADVIVAAPNGDIDLRGRAGIAHVIFGRSDFGVATIIDLSNRLPGQGFAIIGAVLSDRTGSAVSSAGDINGDGYSDILVSSSSADRKGRIDAGTVHVIFGHGNNLPFPDIDLLLFTTGPTTGFIIYGAKSYDMIGSSLSSAGDMNNDGRADIVIGSSSVDALEREDAGVAYVIFGRPTGTLVTDIDLRTYVFGESTGFVVYGGEMSNSCGYSVSSADVNGDGGLDVLVTAPYSAPGGKEFAGTTYVIYGIAPPPPPTAAPTVSPTMSPSQSVVPGYQIVAAALNDNTGAGMDYAGDVNGDGIDDIIVGVGGRTYNGLTQTGVAYVLFGRISQSFANVDLGSFTTSSTSGFKIIGITPSLKVGKSVSGAGDVNGDGYDDVIVGTHVPDTSAVISPGYAYVVFGHGPSMPYTDVYVSFASAPFFGFQISGAASRDGLGFSVSGAGDFNNDGFADVIVGSQRGDPSVDRENAGISYVILGHSNATAFPNIALSSFITSNSTGFAIFGEAFADRSGKSVSGAGDVNGDGYDDVI